VEAERATVPAHFAAALVRLGDKPILEDREGTVGLKALLEDAAALARGLERAGVRPGDRVGFFADNSRRWIVSDLAIQVAGAISVPRGTDTPDDEAATIFAHAEVGHAFAHDAKTAARLESFRDRVPTLRDVIAIEPGGATGPTFDALVAEGRGGPSFAERAARVRPEDVATIIYTSGTTGRPKGVVLAQSNFGHQLAVIPGVLRIGPTDVFLSILPPWHIFERTVEYVALTRGARLVYTDRRRFRDDLGSRGSTFVPSVPRIWESVYDAVRKKVAEGPALRRALFDVAYAVSDLHAEAWQRARGHVVRERRPRGLGVLAEGLARGGAHVAATVLRPLDALAHAVVFRKVKALTGGAFRGAVVGGGKMPPHVDLFFRSVGIGVLVGYGLTETSPVLTVRREERNVLGSIGTAIPGVELEIRDPATGKALPAGETGVVWTRGPQVMRGYHKDPELTARVMGADGWFDTGDLGMLTEYGDLCFRGRAKETIVLAGGENVEPSRVEEAISPSPLVEQVVVVGQDRKTLAALVLPRAAEVAKALGLPPETAAADLSARPDALAIVREDVVRRTGHGSGLRPFEVVARVALLPEALTPENGLLTGTLKAKRNVIAERHARLIEACYPSEGGLR
jgi:long-chain acyl-CoA synthetase